MYDKENEIMKGITLTSEVFFNCELFPFESFNFSVVGGSVYGGIF